MTKLSYFRLHCTIGWCNFVLTSTSIYLYLGLPLIMREQGWSGTEIGLFQMSGLPVVLKFLFASPIDRFRFKYSNYVKWSFVLGCVFLLCLFVLSSLKVETMTFKTLFIIALFTSFVVSWLDVPVNALAIERLPELERSKTGVIRSSVTAFSAVIGGGLMLLVYASLGWSWPFYLFVFMALLAGILLVTVGHVFPPIKDEKANERSGKTLSFFTMWKGYFQRPNMGMWNVLLMVYFPFIGTAWLYLKPVMLDMGIGLENVAWIASLCGVLAALASFTYSLFMYQFSPYRVLFLFSILNVLALFGMYIVVSMAWSDWRLIVAVMGVSIVLGLSSGVLFGLIMNYSRTAFSASDYGLQSSLFSFTRILVPISAGIILDKTGYSGMYLWLILGAVVVCILSFYWMRLNAPTLKGETL
ncbi:MFS transporter [Marinomonas sp. RSW2]|uniref:MFS transporter n=1 Tax=Marinomonas maritima TaxID=2940935 RepID=A0ABT5W9A5_9GAMM|nr:MFS transporter [Marinomonas maritima]MDE8601405.1 MFS transporter [Marinomonas maritima]